MSVINRINRLRGLMDERNYDACLLRDVASLRWLTGAVRVFDNETAHTALITKDNLWFHTDSRYFNALSEKLGPETPWVLDMEIIDGPAWAANHLKKLGSHAVAIEDTLPVGFLDEFEYQMNRASGACLLPRLHGDIFEMRAVKDTEELKTLQKAQDITDDTFAHMCSYIKVGMTEMEIRAELEHYMFSNGADALSFDTIVASGPNTANPHAKPGNRVVQEGDFVLMDYGAGLEDYHADMTRTVVMGAPSAKQQEIYDIVRHAHEACAKAVQIGKTGKEIHELAVKIISDAGYGDYFKHGLGHGVGIDIHEEPRFSMKDTHKLQAGNVVTIEPGIYLPGYGGVRLEDCGVITENGYEPFTKSTHDLVVL